MSTFNFIQPVEFLMRYEADTIEDARTKALEFSTAHTVGDFWDAAHNLWILDPREDTDDCEIEITKWRVELLERKAEQNNKLRSALSEMVQASECVVAAWERGDLAGAVNFLECASEEAVELLEQKS